jgi:hypothetical protein
MGTEASREGREERKEEEQYDEPPISMCSVCRCGCGCVKAFLVFCMCVYMCVWGLH